MGTVRLSPFPYSYGRAPIYIATSQIYRILHISFTDYVNLCNAKSLSDVFAARKIGSLTAKSLRLRGQRVATHIGACPIYKLK